MKNSIQYIIIIILAVFTALYFFKPRIVNIHDEVARIDSVYFTVYETSIPDTVIEYLTRIKEAVPETIKVTETKIRVNTVYKEHDVPYFRSVKKFSAELIGGKVEAFAKCPVDSFHVETSLNREAFAKLYAKTVKEDNTFYWVGGALLVGVIIGGIF